MKEMIFVGLLIIVAFNGVLVLATPNFHIGNVEFGDDVISDDKYKMVMSETYGITTTYDDKKEECTEHVMVTGKGVGDVFDLPCTSNGIVTITSNNMLIYGDPEKDTFSLFTNKPSTLFVFKDGKCVKKTYTTVTRTTMSESLGLDDEQCLILKQKVTYTLGQESKYLQILDVDIDGEPPAVVTRSKEVSSVTGSVTDKGSLPDQGRYSYVQEPNQDHPHVSPRSKRSVPSTRGEKAPQQKSLRDMVLTGGLDIYLVDYLKTEFNKVKTKASKNINNPSGTGWSKWFRSSKPKSDTNNA